MEDIDKISDLGKQIISLRSLGLVYSDIAKKLKCSKSTVSYWCNPKTKETIKLRRDTSKEDNPGLFKFKKAVGAFRCRKENSRKRGFCKDWRRKFRESVARFKKRNEIMINEEYSYNDALEKFGGLSTKCYLTGRKINIEKDDFALDHKIPVSKGGSNELSNMEIAVPEANASKTNLTVEEYISLCIEILTNFGYTISK